MKMNGGVKLSFAETDPSYSAFVGLHSNISDLISPF